MPGCDVVLAELSEDSTPVDRRGQAFDVCSQLVDRIKARVPIWKEQFFADGTVEWVGAGEQLPSERPLKVIEK